MDQKRKKLLENRLFEFQWPVHKGGYQWVEIAWDSVTPPEVPPGTFWGLVPALGEDAQPSPMQVSRPLQDATGLFRTFANTEPTREAIRAFANKYGLLGGAIDRRVMLPWPPESDHIVPIHGERFEAWVYELLLMRQVISLWDMTRKENVVGLGCHVRWHGQDHVYYQSTPGMPNALPSWTTLDSELRWDAQGTPHLDLRTWITVPRYRSELLDGLKAGDLIKPALFFIQQVVNGYLERLVTPKMLWDKKWRELLLRFMPTSLHGALWLQCAQAINGNKDYRQCQASQCTAWFELAPQVARSDKQFCSDACKTRTYRERQRHARQLYAEGTPLHAIVQQVGSDVETVQKWLRHDS